MRSVGRRNVWRLRITLDDRYPGIIGRGLIAISDVFRVKGHEYPRYFFSNLSADIREMFRWACALVGVESRPAGPRNVAVSRRASVEILDRFIGPKA